MSKIITVSREFGSGGRQFARNLAEILGFEYYDKEILAEIAKNTELSEEYIKSVVDRKPHSLFPISIGHSFSSGMDYQLMQMQQIFSAQFDTITELAEKSDCVIVGRCADYILRDKNPYRIFVYADMDKRIQRCIDHVQGDESDDPEVVKKWIIKLDKDRAKYYEDYTGQKWGDKQYFDLCVNTSKFDIKNLAESIAEFYRKYSE
jgi:cytidylate kinase